jgi:hypothetical protein
MYRMICTSLCILQSCVGFLSLFKPSYIHEIIIVLLFNFDGNKSKNVHYMRFEVSLAATMQFTVFWDVKPCSIVDVYQYRCRLQIMWYHIPNDGLSLGHILSDADW